MNFSHCLAFNREQAMLEFVENDLLPVVKNQGYTSLDLIFALLDLCEREAAKNPEFPIAMLLQGFETSSIYLVKSEQYWQAKKPNRKTAEHRQTKSFITPLSE
jgi:hypothetical protein